MFKVAIFDLNGTIIEDEGIWQEAFADVFAKLGVAGVPETKPGVGLHDNWQYIQSLHPEITLPVDVLVEQTLAAYQVRITTVRGYRDGFEELMSFLQAHKVLRILATSSSQPTWQKVATHFPTLQDYFDQIVTGDMVAKRKPAPDIFIKALAVANESLGDGYTASDCVVFEDSVAGVVAAQAAGMAVIWLPNGIESSDMVEASDLEVRDFSDPTIREFITKGGV